MIVLAWFAIWASISSSIYFILLALNGATFSFVNYLPLVALVVSSWFLSKIDKWCDK